MITKGELLSIDYNSNTCTVRLPLFETTGNKDKVIVNGIFSILPGIYNGYKVGDIVEVGFEDHQISKAVVIGKLYLGSEKEKENSGGTVKGDNIVAVKSCSIPFGTTFSRETPDDIANVELIDNLRSLLQAVKDLQNIADNKDIVVYSKSSDQLVGYWVDGTLIYRKVLEVSNPTRMDIGTLPTNLDKVLFINGSYETSGSVKPLTDITIDKTTKIISISSTANITAVRVAIDYTKKK